MVNTHAAPGQAAGYLYQCERGLLELLQRAGTEPDLTLFLEKLDDIELAVGGSPIEVLQVKHHTGPGGDLSDTSVDLWRTIRVWVDIWPQLLPEERPFLTILTTSRAPEGSVAALLKDVNRDAGEALRRLLEVASSSASTSTRKAREAFLKMDPDERRRLVEAVFVRDAQPLIEDIDNSLKAALRVGAREEHLVGLIESLKGWWYGQCVALLRGLQRAVSATDLLNRIYDLRDTYHPDNLPFDYDWDDLSTQERTGYETRLFIQQLKWIAASDKHLQIAVDDYHRAYMNRSRWARLGLVHKGEVDDYKDKLVIEWQRRHVRMEEELSPSASEEERQAAGRRLLGGLDDDCPVHIRKNFDDPNLNRGTYHQLADDKRVGWHPMFVDRLRELLESSA